MNIFKKKKLTKAINIAMATALDFAKDKVPTITQNFFYGAYDIAPQHLVIWYLFKTNKDFELAKANGLTDFITKVTEKSLVENGYPSEAFVDTAFPTDKITFANGSPKQQSDIINMLSHARVLISFTTEQDIQEKADGNQYLYFK